MLQFGILIYFADCRTDGQAACLHHATALGFCLFAFSSPDSHSFSNSGAFYRMCEHNNFLRLSLSHSQTKVDIYDDGMSDGPLRKGALGSGALAHLGLSLRDRHVLCKELVILGRFEVIFKTHFRNRSYYNLNLRTSLNAKSQKTRQKENNEQSFLALFPTFSPGWQSHSPISTDHRRESSKWPNGDTLPCLRSSLPLRSLASG